MWRLKVCFGENQPISINWDKSIVDFPSLFRYKDKKWEFFSQELDKTGYYDKIFIFSEIPTFDPQYYAYMQDFEDLFGNKQNACECGSGHGSFEWDHMRFCKLWKPWGDL